jgi:hypothetical protein
MTAAGYNKESMIYPLVSNKEIVEFMRDMKQLELRQQSFERNINDMQVLFILILKAFLFCICFLNPNLPGIYQPADTSCGASEFKTKSKAYFRWTSNPRERRGVGRIQQTSP